MYGHSNIKYDVSSMLFAVSVVVIVVVVILFGGGGVG